MRRKPVPMLAAALLSLAVAGAATHAGAATSGSHDHTGHHASHDHASHDHSGHDHSGHDHSGHDGHGQALGLAHSEHAAHAGHEAHAGHGTAAQSPEAVAVRFVDVALLDQNGRTQRLQPDVIGDHIVVMDFVYTSCTTVCPVVSAIMGEVQARLGERVGRDVRLVSLTVDPQRDTPARLKAYAGTHRAGAGWVWLTGSVSAVNDTLKGLGTWTPNFEDHPVVMMVGDGRSGEWTRFYGFVDPAALVARVEQLTAARHRMGAK